MKGLLLIAIGLAWLGALLWSFKTASGRAMGIGIAVGPGTPEWITQAVLKAILLAVALGWLVPLTAGIFLAVRER